MSERGKSSLRPYPPTAATAVPARRAGALEEVLERGVDQFRAPARRPHPVVARRVRPLEGLVLGPEPRDGVGRGAHATVRERRGPSRPSGSG